MYKKLFLERFGNSIVSEFTYDGMMYVFYYMTDNNLPYITGDKYEWKTGLQFSTEIGHVIDLYYVDDMLKRVIAHELKKI